MIGIFDKFSLIGMALGVAMMLQPWWPDRFRAGFFLTIVTTIVQIITSHLPQKLARTFQNNRRRGFEPVLQNDISKSPEPPQDLR